MTEIGEEAKTKELPATPLVDEDQKAGQKDDTAAPSALVIATMQLQGHPAQHPFTT